MGQHFSFFLVTLSHVKLAFKLGHLRVRHAGLCGDKVQVARLDLFLRFPTGSRDVAIMELGAPKQSCGTAPKVVYVELLGLTDNS